MFNKEFYPTPESLGMKMAGLFDFKLFPRYERVSILEPSAGKGDLLAPLQRRLKINDTSAEFDVIEIEEDLRAILREKEDTHVIFDDFLRFQTGKQYHGIVMNPPFQNGARHLLHALDLLQNGGQIVCLLNAETLRNPFTNERKELLVKLEEIVQTGGTVKTEYLDDAFVSAERKSNVEVALSHIVIPQKEPLGEILSGLQKAKEKATDTEKTTYLTAAEQVQAAIERFNFEVEVGLKLFEELKAAKECFAPPEKEAYGAYGELLALQCDDKEFTVNQYVKAVRRKYWDLFFKNNEFRNMLTSDLQNSFDGLVNELVDYDFNLFNINAIKQKMAASMEEGLHDAIITLFENLSAKHSWMPECGNNIHYYNGWATNKAYKVNDKKVIVPACGVANTESWRSGVFDTYRAYRVLEDLEKAMNYLEDGTFAEVDMRSQLRISNETGQTQKIPLRYFYVTFYKKGTCHIEFRPETKKIIERLNIYGSQKKGWLPPSYGKKSYSELSAEEKQVIDAFQGEEKYAAVMRDSAYYLGRPGLLALNGGEQKCG